MRRIVLILEPSCLREFQPIRTDSIATIVRLQDSVATNMTRHAYAVETLVRETGHISYALGHVAGQVKYANHRLGHDAGGRMMRSLQAHRASEFANHNNHKYTLGIPCPVP